MACPHTPTDGRKIQSTANRRVARMSQGWPRGVSSVLGIVALAEPPLRHPLIADGSEIDNARASQPRRCNDDERARHPDRHDDPARIHECRSISMLTGVRFIERPV